jgi:hypothetical protein
VPLVKCGVRPGIGPHPHSMQLRPHHILHASYSGPLHLMCTRACALCIFVCANAGQAANVREKEMKRQTLLELVDYVNTGTGKFTELVSEVSSHLRCCLL